MRVGASLVVLAAACGSGSETTGPESTKTPAVAIETAVARGIEVPDFVVVVGKVIADEHSDIVPDTAGKVISVLVERGQKVNAGAALVSLDVRNATLGAAEARANLGALRSQRQLADDECKRSRELFDKGAITRSQFDREQASCTAAGEQVTAAEARARMMAKSITDGVIRAPFAGVVTDVLVAPGEWAAPGMRLVTLVDSDPLSVELQIPEAVVSRVALDQTVLVESVSFRDEQVRGKITRISGEISRQSKSMLIEAELEPGSKLLPGMAVAAAVVIGKVTLPEIPRKAVEARGQAYRLFVVVGDRLEERVVSLGPDTPTKDATVTILRGLAIGDRVANPISEQVVDGLRVAVSGEPSTALAPPPEKPVQEAVATPPPPPAPGAPASSPSSAKAAGK